MTLDVVYNPKDAFSPSGLGSHGGNSTAARIAALDCACSAYVFWGVFYARHGADLSVKVRRASPKHLLLHVEAIRIHHLGPRCDKVGD